MNIKKKAPMEIFFDGDKSILRKYEPAFVFSGIRDDNIKFDGRTICKECIEKTNK